MNRCLIIAAVPRTIDLFLGPHMQQLSELGMDVHVASSGRPVVANEQRRTFHPVPFSRSAFDLIGHVRAWRSCRRLLDELGGRSAPLLLHLHTPIAAALARLALRRRHNARVLYMAHGFHFLPGERNVYYWIERALARWTDLYVLINADDVISARQFCRNDPTRWTTIPGVGLQRVRPAESAADRAMPATDEAEPVKRVLVLGVLEERKHPELALRAAALLDANTHVHFCGDGPQELMLKALAVELGCAHRVHFEGWTSEVAPWFERSDCLLFLSDREGLPMAVAEALISRLAVVAFDIRGVRDLLEGLNGWKVPRTRSATAVSQAIDAALATRIDGPAYQRRAAHFSLAASLQAHGSAVRRLMHQATEATADSQSTVPVATPAVE